MNLAVDLCFALAQRLVIRRDQSGESTTDTDSPPEDSLAAGANPHTFDHASYRNWRNKSLDAQFHDHFECAQLSGKRVLDFGCGSGYLSKLATTCDAASVDGLDLSPKKIEAAKHLYGESSNAISPRFHVGSNAKYIDFDDDSFDIILCFDVVEHIMQYKEIIREWKRVLAPGGRILIWWQPYYHPWGHHLLAAVPIPWAHVLFSNETLAEVSYRIRQIPQYKPRLWDLDEGGNRILRPKGDPKILGGVNRLTIREFDGICKETGLKITRNDAYAFNGPKVVRSISRLLSHTPFLQEGFTAYLIYEIENPS